MKAVSCDGHLLHPPEKLRAKYDKGLPTMAYKAFCNNFKEVGLPDEPLEIPNIPKVGEIAPETNIPTYEDLGVTEPEYDRLVEGGETAGLELMKIKL